MQSTLYRLHLSLHLKSFAFHRVYTLHHSIRTFRQRLPTPIFLCRTSSDDQVVEETSQEEVPRIESSGADLGEDNGIGVVRKRGRRKSTRAKGKRLSLLHRYRIAQGRRRKKHSSETRQKISETLRRHHEEKRKLQSSSKDSSIRRFSKIKKNSIDPFVMEKAILELTSLRRDLSLWLDGWYSKHEHKPTLDDVAQHSPEMRNKFMRYIALREFLQTNN